MRKVVLATILILIFFSLNRCFIIQIQEGVDYPSQIFKQAQDEIKKIQIKCSKKNIRAHKMNILVYDGESRDLVRISLPILVVNLGLKTGLKYAEHDVAKTSSRYIDIDWERLQNLSELGPGLLVEVEDLEERSHVLIWLQ